MGVAPKITLSRRLSLPATAQTAVSISIACASDRFSREIVVRFVSRCPWPGSLIILNEVPVYARAKILREYSRHVNEK